MKTTNIILALFFSILLSSCKFSLKDYKIEDDIESKQAVEKDLTALFKEDLISKMISETFSFGTETFFYIPVSYVETHMDGASYKYATSYNSEQVDNLINQWYENGYAPGYLDDIFKINSAADFLPNEEQMISKKNQIISDRFKEIDSQVDTNVSFLWERQPYVDNSNVLIYKVTAFWSEVYSKDFLVKFQLNENEELDYFIE